MKVRIEYCITEQDKNDVSDIREELDLALQTTMLINGYRVVGMGMNLQIMTRWLEFEKSDGDEELVPE